MNKCDVLEYKNSLEYAEKMFQNAQKTLDLCGERLDEAQKEYRFAEIEYVLGGLLQKNAYEQLSQKEVDLYLTHCINVIHGNIDGVVLDMEKETSDDN